MGLGKASLSFTKLLQEEIDWTTRLPRLFVVGRSNVGKSSLLNALIHPQRLFRSGSTPGVTRGIIAVDVVWGKSPGPKLQIIDLPGWGYARRPQDEVNVWNQFSESLAEVMRDNAEVLWLIDTRRKPDALDERAREWLGSLIWWPVLMKSDQVKRTERKACEKKWGVLLQSAAQDPLWASAKNAEGLDELQKRVRNFVSGAASVDGGRV